MSKILFNIVLGLVIFASLVSCNKDEDPGLQWRRENEAIYHQYAKKEGYKEVSLDGFSGKVAMKWLTHGSGKENPIQTSRVECYYSMAELLDTTNVFDSNWSRRHPMTFSINRGKQGGSLIRGVQIALQSMVVGDECYVAIPWYLGYPEGNPEALIRPQTALFYHVLLVATLPEENN